MSKARKRFPLGAKRPTLPTHVESRDSGKGFSSPQIFAAILVLGITLYGTFLWYSNWQVKRLLYTPHSSDKIAPKQADMKRFWGSYRPQVYFGMKTMSPLSLVTGMMWLQQLKEFSHPSQDELPLRHTCEQGDHLHKYGWIAHDGLNFGMQDIVDNDFILRTEFVKLLGGDHGGDWSWRITGRGTHRNATVSLFFYAATDQEGTLNPRVKDSRLFFITGSTKDLGDFVIRFPKSDNAAKQQFHHTVTQVEGLHKLKEGVLRKLTKSQVTTRVSGGRKLPFYTLRSDTVSDAIVKDAKSKLLVHQVTIETPFEVEVLFQSGSVKQRQFELSGSMFSNQLATFKMKFDQKFEARYPLRRKGYGDEEVAFAKAAFSNMIGGIGHFYGSSFVQSQYEAEPLPYWEAHLLTAVPSRSFFPRGFLWDEGFHQLLISKWDRELSLLILSHWLDTMNAEGWIPREQILGDEARSKVPAEFVVQRNTNANPPTFFLALQSIMSDMKSSLKGMSESERGTLKKMFPKLQAWFNWFNDTQSGPVPGSYRWRGRDATSDRELNARTLTSGLDDYPRASHPSDKERHVDLRCWLAFASNTMAKIAAEIGADPTKFKATSDYLMDNKLLNKLHWSDKLNSYADYGNHTAKVALVKKQFPPERQGMPMTQRVIRQTRGTPTLQLVNAKGYVSLFPFLLKILEPDSPQLLKVLSNLTNPDMLWTDYGLRSLSQKDPLFMKRNTEHDPPYWRGQIWININFLAVRALKHYATVSQPPISDLADEIYHKLRTNLVRNVFNQYRKTGYVWENYAGDTGAGEGCHPFTGWSALVVLIMSEEYGAAEV